MEKEKKKRAKPKKKQTGKKNPQRHAKKRMFTLKKNDQIRAHFKQLIESGETWSDAVKIAGIDAIEAAQIVDDTIRSRRDGVAVYMLAEKHLIKAMSILAELAQNVGDERIKLMAAAKLADTSFRVLANRPYIDKVQSDIPQIASTKNAWDVEFEDVYKN